MFVGIPIFCELYAIVVVHEDNQYLCMIKKIKRYFHFFLQFLCSQNYNLQISFWFRLHLLRFIFFCNSFDSFLTVRVLCTLSFCSLTTSRLWATSFSWGIGAVPLIAVGTCQGLSLQAAKSTCRWLHFGDYSLKKDTC